MHAALPTLVAGLWVLWGAFWLISAWGTKPVLRGEGRLASLLHIGPAALAAWLLIGPVPAWLDGRFLPPGSWFAWLGLPLLVGGLGWTVWARRWLGREWSGRVTLKQDHVLIQGGPYRFTRHPIYSGILAGFAGTVLALGVWRGLAALVLLAGAFLRKIVAEERLLATRFPDQYARYRAAVPKLLAWPRRRRHPG